MTRDDPELGLVRLCRGCHEEWPYDAEFWHIKDGKLDQRWPGRCIACCLEYFAERRRTRQRIKRQDRTRPVPVPGRCNALMLGGRCGRFDGHAHKHRTTTAMADDSARQRSGDKPVLSSMTALDTGGVEPTEYRGPR